LQFRQDVGKPAREQFSDGDNVMAKRFGFSLRRLRPPPNSTEISAAVEAMIERAAAAGDDRRVRYLRAWQLGLHNISSGRESRSLRRGRARKRG